MERHCYEITRFVSYFLIVKPVSAINGTQRAGVARL